MPLGPTNKRITSSSIKLFHFVPVNQKNILRSSDDNTKTSLNHFGKNKDLLLSSDNDANEKALEKREEDEMMLPSGMEHLKIDNNESAFKSPTTYDSTSCFQYERSNEYVESFISISEDHAQFSIFDFKFEEKWNKKKSIESKHSFHRSSSQLPSSSQSSHSLPQSLLLPIL